MRAFLSYAGGLVAHKNLVGEGLTLLQYYTIVHFTGHRSYMYNNGMTRTLFYAEQTKPKYCRQRQQYDAWSVHGF